MLFCCVFVLGFRERETSGAFGTVQRSSGQRGRGDHPEICQGLSRKEKVQKNEIRHRQIAVGGQRMASQVGNCIFFLMQICWPLIFGVLNNRNEFTRRRSNMYKDAERQAKQSKRLKVYEEMQKRRSQPNQVNFRSLWDYP